MPPKRKATRKSLVQKRQEEEERRELEEREADPEQEEKEAERDSDTASNSTGKRAQTQTFTFSAESEEKLVEFFTQHDCFYNKTSPQYSNTAHKRKLLQGIARELGTEYDKIEGWFKNQRTAVGKLYKKKSGQAAEILTARKQWQLKSFTFLKQHIVPRSYTHDTGPLPCKVSESEDDEEAELEGEVEEDRASASSSLKTGSTTAVPSSKRGSKRSRKVEDALLDYLSQPWASQSVAQKVWCNLESHQTPLDERTAFGQWFCARLLKVPDNEWDGFQDAVQALLKEFTQPARRTTQPLAQVAAALWRQSQWPQQPQWQQPHQQDVPFTPCNHSTPATVNPQVTQPTPPLRPQSVEVGLPPLSESFMNALQSAGVRQPQEAGPSTTLTSEVQEAKDPDDGDT